MDMLKKYGMRPLTNRVLEADGGGHIFFRKTGAFQAVFAAKKFFTVPTVKDGAAWKNAAPSFFVI